MHMYVELITLKQTNCNLKYMYIIKYTIQFQKQILQTPGKGFFSVMNLLNKLVPVFNQAPLMSLL